jgi:hypothetical protein
MTDSARALALLPAWARPREAARVPCAPQPLARVRERGRIGLAAWVVDQQVLGGCDSLTAPRRLTMSSV